MNITSEFDKQHGDRIQLDGYFYFEDGAVRDVNPLGVLRKPPSDMKELNANKLTYAREKLGYAEETFHERREEVIRSVKAALTTEMPICSHTKQTIEEELTHLKQQVEHWRNLVAELEGENERLNPEDSRISKMADEQRAKNEEALSLAQSINI